ncbi:MAG: ArnT family glycosyltransferase [Patescibacteria group bacterium]
MNRLSTILGWMRRQWWYVSYLLVIIMSLSLFTYVQTISTFPDPDSFYHIQMSRSIVEHGVITEFPWLQVSTLKDAYINQHFLYHVLLIPFTEFADPILGAKFVQVMLNTALIVLMYSLFRRHRVPFAFWFTVLLLVTTPFMFRLNLVKAPVVSLLFLFGGLYALFRYRYLTLLFISGAFVWAYGGFIVLPIAAGAYALVSIGLDWFRDVRRSFWLVISHSRELRMMAIVLAGTLAGIIINPHFPTNLQFYWQQLVQIGVVNYQTVIPVGGEWYPYKLFDLWTQSVLVTVLAVLAAILMGLYRTYSRKQLALFLLFIFYLAFTLKSRRYVEYYIPVTVTWIAFTVQHVLRRQTMGDIGKAVWQFATRYSVVTTILVVYFAVGVPAVVAKDLVRLRSDYMGGIPVTRFAGAGQWLSTHAQPGDIVFHSSWDEFPILFFRSPSTYYISGLDPTFTYEYSPELYRHIVDITTGKDTDKGYELIRDTFHARYVFIESSHHAMERMAEESNGLRRAYRDDEASIYEVLPQSL